MLRGVGLGFGKCRMGGVLAVSVVLLAACNNNFGSSYDDVGAVDKRVYLGDSTIQEWSVLTAYHNPSVASFDDVVDVSLEFTFDDATDLIVNRGPRNTQQDVRIVPVNWIDPLPGEPAGQVVFGRTTCDTDHAAIYGQHPAKVCDKKFLLVNMYAWYQLATDNQRRVVAHEFGHALGLRHSNDAYGVSDQGFYEPIEHDDPDASIMVSGDDIWQSPGLTAGDKVVVNGAY